MKKDEYKIRIATKKEWALEEQIAQEFGKPKTDLETKSETAQIEAKAQPNEPTTEPQGT